MPRTAVVPRQLAKNSNLIGTTGSTTIDATLVTNGVTIANARPEQLFIRVANTEGSTNTVTVKAGVAPPALRGGQGDLVVTVAATTGVQYMGPFESDKYLQADGSIWFDFETAMTGTFDALYWPRDI
jgi:hypothetical protein